MATDLEPRAATKADAFVDRQLGEVRSRIRRVDISRCLLWLGVVVLGHGLLMAVLDLALPASSALVGALRLGLFVGFLGLAGWCVAQTLRCVYRSVNPYYAARQIEETIPQAKNSVINWLDLKEEKLPTAIRGALGSKAVRDLKQADSDKIVNPRSNWLLLSVLSALFISLLVLLALRPNQFASLLARAYLPFQGRQIDTRVQITLLRPENGDLTLPPDSGVAIRARITGTHPRADQPGGPRLLFRYSQADPFVPIPMEDEGDGVWSIQRKPDQVRTGFFYKVAAGDAETPQYEIAARSAPRPIRFDVSYRYRPYLRLDDEAQSFPRDLTIQALRGTAVTLTVATNRKLREGQVALDVGGEKQTFEGKLLDDGASFQCSWTLNRSGSLRVFFVSTEGEPNSDASIYSVIVDDDAAPRVVLTEPGKDVHLPANGTLQLAGHAKDDFGIRDMALRLKVVKGDPVGDIAGKLFRDGKDFKFEDGSYPDRVDYRDFVALDALSTADGKSLPLSPGMVLEYWLEAHDCADHPAKEGNLGVSKAFRVTIDPPAKDDRAAKEQRDKAAQGQKDFEKKQDDRHAKENKERGEAKGGSKSSADERKRDAGEDLARKLADQKKEEEPGEAKGAEGGDSKSKGGESSKPGAAEPKTKEGKGDPKEKNGDGKGKGEGGKGGPAPAEAKGKGEKDRKDSGEDPGAGGAARGEGSSSAPASAKDSKDRTSDKSEGKGGGEGMMGTDKAAGAARDEGGKKSDGSISSAKGGDPAKKDAGAAEAAAKAGEDNTRGSPKPGEGDGKKGESPQPSAKGGKASGAEAKKGPGGEPGGAGEARGDGRKRDDAAKAKDPSADELAKLKEALNDAERGDDAARELSRIAREAADAKTRDAARDALKEDGRAADTPARTKPAGDDKKEGTGTAKSGGETTDAASPKTGGADPSTAKAAADTKEEAEVEVKLGPHGPGGGGFEEQLNKARATEDFLRKGGNLQLQDLIDYLKKHAPADALERAGWSKEELADWLKWADAHDRRLAAEKAARKDGKLTPGGVSVIPGSRPGAVGAAPSTTRDPLVGGRPQPPPEFREPHRVFTDPRK